MNKFYKILLVIIALSTVSGLGYKGLFKVDTRYAHAESTDSKFSELFCDKWGSAFDRKEDSNWRLEDRFKDRAMTVDAKARYRKNKREMKKLAEKYNKNCTD